MNTEHHHEDGEDEAGEQDEGEDDGRVEAGSEDGADTRRWAGTSRRTTTLNQQIDRTRTKTMPRREN